MLRDDVANLIAQRVGKRTDMLAAIVAEMQYVQAFVLEQHLWLPWFLETENAETQTLVGEERVRLPDDFLGEIEDQHLWIKAATDSEWSALTKLEYDEAFARYQGTGRPMAYAMTAEYFTMHYTPDDTYTLRMRYYGRATSLATNIENQWLKWAADVMIAECGQIIAGRYIQNAALGQQFADDATVAWDRLYRQHIAREQVNNPAQMGDE